jgi:hypothetical protein
VVSKEIYNRVLIWRFVLKRAYEAMLADDVIWKMLTENIQNEEYHLTYQIASFEDRTYVPHVALCSSIRNW